MLTFSRDLFASRRRFPQLLAIISLLFGSAAHAQTRAGTLAPREMERLRTLQARSTQPAQIIDPTKQPKVAVLDRPTLTLERNQFVRIDVPPETRPTTGGRTRQVMTARFTGLVAPSGNSSTPSDNRTVELAPFIELSDKAMHLSADGSSYTATIFVGLLDEAAPSEQLPLSNVALLLTADRTTITPRSVPIPHTNDYSEATLTSLAPGSEIELVVHFNMEKVTTLIPVTRPHIVLGKMPSALAGWGVGSADVTVQLSEDAGSLPRHVSVSFDPGSVDSSMVIVSALRPATVRFRTEGLGDSATFTAESELLRSSVSGTIPLTFPTAFFCAALLGGVLGSLCARLSRLDKSGGSLVRQFVAGVIAGVIGAGLYLLGVNVSGADFKINNSELAVAVVAALVAIAGVGALKLVKTGSGKEP